MLLVVGRDFRGGYGGGGGGWRDRGGRGGGYGGYRGGGGGGYGGYDRRGTYRYTVYYQYNLLFKTDQLYGILMCTIFDTTVVNRDASIKELLHLYCLVSGCHCYTSSMLKLIV